MLYDFGDCQSGPGRIRQRFFLEGNAKLAMRVDKGDGAVLKQQLVTDFL